MTAAPQQPAADRIIRWPQLARIICISRASVDRLERAGQFPARQQLTEYTVGWRASDVQEWVAGKRDWRAKGAA